MKKLETGYVKWKHNRLCWTHVSRISVQQSYTPYLLTSHALALILMNSHVCKEACTAELSMHTVYWDNNWSQPLKNRYTEPTSFFWTRCTVILVTAALYSQSSNVASKMVYTSEALLCLFADIRIYENQCNQVMWLKKYYWTHELWMYHSSA